MESTYTSLDELLYYRNLLTLEVGDKIKWVIGATIGHASGHTGRELYGVITAIFPNGKGNFEGKQHAFMTVHVPTPSGLSYAVQFTNPTIRKLETDK